MEIHKCRGEAFGGFNAGVFLFSLVNASPLHGNHRIFLSINVNCHKNRLRRKGGDENNKDTLQRFLIIPIRFLTLNKYAVLPLITGRTQLGYILAFDGDLVLDCSFPKKALFPLFFFAIIVCYLYKFMFICG